MAEKVKLSKDGSSIDFVQSESIPTSVKKFRQSPEIEGFYRFIYENDLQKEAYEILERIVTLRKAKKKLEKQEAAPKKAEVTVKMATVKKKTVVTVEAKKVAVKAAPTKKAAPVKKAVAKAAPAKKAKTTAKPAAKKAAPKKKK